METLKLIEANEVKKLAMKHLLTLNNTKRKIMHSISDFEEFKEQDLE
jgi:hypothetical protein